MKTVLAEEGSKVIVFVNTRTLAEALSQELTDGGFRADYITGTRSQSAREWIVEEFRKPAADLRVLVATDVLQRGLDIPGVSHIVMWEMCCTIDEYLHRCGRTGRHEDVPGTVLTLFEFWPKYPRLATDLVRILEETAQHVPPALRAIATEQRLKHGWA